MAEPYVNPAELPVKRRENIALGVLGALLFSAAVNLTAAQPEGTSAPETPAFETPVPETPVPEMIVFETPRPTDTPAPTSTPLPTFTPTPDPALFVPLEDSVG